MKIKYPSADKHLYISLIKSVIRIGSGVALLSTIPIAGYLLIGAEILGILEELL